MDHFVMFLAQKEGFLLFEALVAPSASTTPNDLIRFIIIFTFVFKSKRLWLFCILKMARFDGNGLKKGYHSNRKDLQKFFVSFNNFTHDFCIAVLLGQLFVLHTSTDNLRRIKKLNIGYDFISLHAFERSHRPRIKRILISSLPSR